MSGPYLFDGWWMPVDSKEALTRYLRHQRDSDPAIRLCRQRRSVVQAGAHIGSWPRRLAGKFKRVITVEPEPGNFECAKRNTQRCKNVEVYHGLLGEAPGKGSLIFNARNTGGHKCQFDGEGALPVFAIDRWGLDDCDAIILDVEGAELPALKGAVETIERCRPVIQLEFWGHAKRSGYTEEDLREWLAAQRYKVAGKVSHDWVFKPA